jgi:hypothetical protein
VLPGIRQLTRQMLMCKENNEQIKKPKRNSSKDGKSCFASANASWAAGHGTYSGAAYFSEKQKMSI